MVFMVLSPNPDPLPENGAIRGNGFTRLGRPLGGAKITAFSRSLVFYAKAAYMRSIDISADRSGPRDLRVC
ncbi:hypothetical protein OOJ09_11220 [Mesorhizobium qingshengii]|uniref:Uncharacterized protein n=1 Tax=Mesorhizobium qingshengii TaxID=1165689 RepID=A0ABT4QT40_9HYPH|nr:hypothetical protein [Mesorhizobium qingshengii]MCZ8544755.1 hypothetical protein [Mesorhizobium qingshengii]